MKTRIPTMRSLLNDVSQYISRNQSVMVANLTPSQRTAFIAFVACLAGLILELGSEPVNP